MDRRIKFRHLEAFAAIARAGSLKLAAERLHLTQPAISKTLKELEGILQVRLMNRGRSGIALTADGEVFLGFAEESLAALRHGLDGLASRRSGEAGRIAVGALPSVAAKLLPKAVRLFRARTKGVRLQIEDGPHGYLTDRLRAGALDLLVGRLGPPETMAEISFSQLYSEHVVVVAAPDHPLVLAQSFEALAGATVLYPTPDAAIRPLVERLMIASGAPRSADRVETVSAVFGRAIATGPDRAIWIISHGVVADDIAAGRLVQLPIDTGLTAGPVGIMQRANAEITPPLRLFRTALTEAAHDYETELAGSAFA